MDYKKIAKELNELAEFYDYMPGRSEKFKECASAITDLLARAEAAEAAQETLQRTMAEYKARTEKAERERDADVQDLRKLVPAWKLDGSKKDGK